MYIGLQLTFDEPKPVDFSLVSKIRHTVEIGEGRKYILLFHWPLQEKDLGPLMVLFGSMGCRVEAVEYKEDFVYARQLVNSLLKQLETMAPDAEVVDLASFVSQLNYFQAIKEGLETIGSDYEDSDGLDESNESDDEDEE